MKNFILFFLKKNYTYNGNNCANNNALTKTLYNSCTISSQCSTGLVCSSAGPSSGYCAKNQAGQCTNDAQCANLLFCNKNTGTCGCTFTSASSLSAVNGE